MKRLRRIFRKVYNIHNMNKYFEALDTTFCCFPWLELIGSQAGYSSISTHIVSALFKFFFKRINSTFFLRIIFCSWAYLLIHMTDNATSQNIFLFISDLSSLSTSMQQWATGENYFFNFLLSVVMVFSQQARLKKVSCSRNFGYDTNWCSTAKWLRKNNKHKNYNPY